MSGVSLDNPSPKKSLETQERLSAMINELDLESSDASSLPPVASRKPESGSSSVGSGVAIISPLTAAKLDGGPPGRGQLTSESDSGSSVSYADASNANRMSVQDSAYRYSMVSNYSGVVHEGTEVSYVVKNRDPQGHVGAAPIGIGWTIDKDSVPKVPKVPGGLAGEGVDEGVDEGEGEDRSRELVIKQITNAKPVSRFSSVHSETPSKPPKLQSGDASGANREPILVPAVAPVLEESSSPSQDDSASIQSSIIPPLTTNAHRTKSRRDPHRTEMAPVIPTAPPRSKARPRTMLFNEDGSEVLAPAEEQEQEQDHHEDAQFVDVTPESKGTQVTSDGKSKQRRRRQHRHEKEGKPRPFSTETISQLLSMTRGTLLGSEFAQLEMRVEEKRALERLVDSLSRLTADMVLDPERYEEGLKRLQRATKALDGF
ncbi:uncharacterized protein KNAG_0K01820 [Huiozyma naganishii CBS 8797]|uniref:Uncharacterized protein n=1 Tax=Huiozyma naganishii (strain ATCC MYA-139 / BCRC 22969 / CBS 8797 / KCTC 17520 / NBRC 10181 / NCYC 3082 / Yp74L-3) TaxID=1071383 RepID=J7S3D9_HUIN7|nr:hypothetical protein KNAG_0K01820 [Kazachstania naganishii CBS 8797]CCK72547.1 hypothetical protein KNAG_0K01820 [Kazachstania naganishii CBS 8797]